MTTQYGSLPRVGFVATIEDGEMVFENHVVYRRGGTREEF